MIQFSNWQLSNPCGTPIARQYDNLSVSLIVVGDLPDGWEWAMLVECQGNLNIIPLSPVEGGVGATLTDDMLALSGYYTMQLRGTQGDVVRHTNQIQVFIPKSLSGDAQWPVVPSEFSQAEARIRELNEHPPIPGDGGYWLVWDLDGERYVTSSLPLPDVPVGPPGQAATITVGETVTGEPGTQAAVENTGTENEAVLRFTIPRGADGPVGATPDISVEVTGLPAESEPTVEVSGTPERPVIALGIPAGQQGSPGQTPNITIGQVTTLPAGFSVTASITGQTPNLVLNLGIPQGAAGAGVPPTTGIPDGYTLQTKGEQAVWGESTGGSGEIELIGQITLDTAVGSGIISVDTNGKPFSLTEAYASIHIPVATFKANFYFYFAPLTKNYISSEVRGNGVSATAVFVSEILESAIISIDVLSAGITSSKITALTALEPVEITEFRFANFEGATLPEGTVIRLCGRRVQS